MESVDYESIMFYRTGLFTIKPYSSVIYSFCIMLVCLFVWDIVYLSKPKVTSLLQNLSISCKLQIRYVIIVQDLPPLAFTTLDDVTQTELILSKVVSHLCQLP